MIYKRALKKILSRYTKFPVVAILGPRQSGKTTFAQHNFKKHQFSSFEDPATRDFAESDPKRFLREHKNKHGLILDEFQYVPKLLSYIQLEVDAKKRPGYFVLTGSENFLMNQAITQSLAGRIGLLTLLPLSLQELKANKLFDGTADNCIFQGSYPRIYSQEINPIDFYPSYIQTYVERDIRKLSNVSDLNTFKKFLKLCAGRIGELLNLSDLATNCGISVPTAHRWISLLEASYIVFLLQPHFKNFNKRLIKSPKIFFYDTGLACSLLEITSTKMLAVSPHRSHLFENLIINDLAKQFFNKGMRPPLYFWRDKNKKIEVDCIIDAGIKLFPIETKSSETMHSDFFDALIQWNAISKTNASDNYIVYAGDTNQSRNKGNVVGWKSTSDLVQKLYAE